MVLTQVEMRDLREDIIKHYASKDNAADQLMGERLNHPSLDRSSSVSVEH